MPRGPLAPGPGLGVAWAAGLVRGSVSVGALVLGGQLPLASGRPLRRENQERQVSSYLGGG